MGDILGDSATLAARLGVTALRLRVVEALDLTPAMRRVRLHDETLRTLAYDAGQDLMVSVPAGEGATTRRRYTIRSIDRDAATVDLDISRHGDGPGARWAVSAVPGSEVDAIGPRGKISLDPDADWHLFIGDETFLPGTAAMVEALPAGAMARVAIEIDGPEEEQPLAGPEAGVTWLHRNGRPSGDPELLTEAASAIDLPPGRGHAYIAGELRVVAEIRKILEGRGMAAEHLSPKPYWRRGVANAAHGEPDR